jgi:hypothetical protein
MKSIIFYLTFCCALFGSATFYDLSAQKKEHSPKNNLRGDTLITPFEFKIDSLPFLEMDSVVKIQIPLPEEEIQKLLGEHKRIRIIKSIETEANPMKDHLIWIEADSIFAKKTDDMEVGILDSGDKKKTIIFLHKPIPIKPESPDVMPKLDDAETIRLYPNPNGGKFNLEFDLKEKGHTEIKIFDKSGNQIYEESLENFTGKYQKEIDLGNISSEMYILKIKQGKKEFVRRILNQ